MLQSFSNPIQQSAHPMHLLHKFKLVDSWSSVPHNAHSFLPIIKIKRTRYLNYT